MNQYPRSFSKRLTTRIILTVLATMGVIAGIISYIAVMVMGSQVNSHYWDVMEITNEKMDLWLSTVEVSAANIEDEVEYNLHSPDEVYRALKDELKLNPAVSGVGVGFIPNYYPEEGYWFEPYATRDADGEIITKQIGGEHHDYFHADWYKTALDSDAISWSDPYIDPDGAEGMLCTYTMLVRDPQKRLVGVLAADLELEWLKKQLQDIDESENRRSIARKYPGEKRFATYSFVLDRSGGYIVHPEPERILSNSYFDYVGEEDADSYKKTGYEMLAGHTGSAKTIMDGIKVFVFYAPLDRTGWSMAIVVPALAIYQPGINIGALILIMMALGILAIFLVSRIGVRNATQPLKYLADSAGEIAKGNFDTRLPDIRHRDEICYLKDSFANMQHSLSTYVDQLTAATAQRASMESELSIAGDIQMSMLPKTFPPFPERRDIDVYATLSPAKVVGGDLYDFFIRDEKLFFCIGDVSGKGIPAALVMSGISTQFRALSAWETRPEAIVSALNESMCSRNESLMFVTFFAGVLDLKDGEMSYCNAGHNAPILAGASTGFLETDANVPIGVQAGWPFSGQKRAMAPGSTLLLYTDGLSEAEDLNHALFGERRILENLPSGDNTTPRETIESLLEAVHQFTEGAEQSDDITMLAIKSRKTDR